MASEQLSAIHLTLVEGEALPACDTFMPPIDEAAFRLWSAAPPRRDGATRYSFLCYTRAGQEGAPALPPATASQHEEQQVGRGRAGGTGAAAWLTLAVPAARVAGRAGPGQAAGGGEDSAAAPPGLHAEPADAR